MTEKLRTFGVLKSIWRIYYVSALCITSNCQTAVIAFTPNRVHTKYKEKSWFHEIFIHEREFLVLRTKTRSRFLRKNQPFFRQINVFTKEVNKSWFDEIFWAWLRSIHGVEICKFFPHDFLQKVPSNQLFFTKELYCKLIWRKNIIVLFHTLMHARAYCNLEITKKFRQINAFVSKS